MREGKETLWQARGITSVPAFIVNTTDLIAGTQPPETFVHALRAIAAETDACACEKIQYTFRIALNSEDIVWYDFGLLRKRERAMPEAVHSRSSLETALALAKDIIAIGRSLLVLFLLIFCAHYIAFDRNTLKDLLRDFGITKANVLGMVEVDLATSDALPQSAAALEQARNQVKELQAKYTEALAALEASKTAIATPTTPAEVKAREATSLVLQQAPATLAKSAKTAQSIELAQSKAITAIAQLPGANDTSHGFGIVFGGDTTMAQASKQLTLAKAFEDGEARVFLRQGSYRSVVVFDTRTKADAALPKVRALNRYSAQAYVVNLASWCANADFANDPIICS